MFELWRKIASNLGSESSLYDSCIIPSTHDASWYLLLACLAGLALAMVTKRPDKE